MENRSSDYDELKKELTYYKKQLDRFSGESIRNDFVLSSVRHQLKQKKEAIDILTSLQKEFATGLPFDILFGNTVKAINTQLRMDRSVVLVPFNPDSYKVFSWYGYPSGEAATLQSKFVTLNPEWVKNGQYVLLNKSTVIEGWHQHIRENLLLTFFAGTPVWVDNEVIAFIFASRQYEKVPFWPPLDKGDADTLIAIAGLISSIFQNRKLTELKVQKAEVEKQKEAISAQRDILEETLTELRNTQAQLVQREKMASLGELTAGIAHEIQNPLNFVNNFSDINAELIDELNAELNAGNLQPAMELAAAIKENEEKIQHHGKRADGIVKGMLQHSRSGTGQKEPADINSLADEFMRLAYHGSRAKDKSFNAMVKTDFDTTIGKINIVPQDIGRVLLNLYNNAFYAVREKLQSGAGGQDQQAAAYEPLVSVATKKYGNRVSITVSDNGNGIPHNIMYKIFQPFFTTKPTGQGTGLGLSLSYDIIKAHGGTIAAETKEGEGSVFTIQLPIS